jgi:ketol-acid reductoisomerase
MEQSMKIYVESDVETGTTRGTRVAVIGYGSQGRAHARNLQDSGFDVTVGLRPEGASWRRAQQDGMRVTTPEQAAEGADIVAMLMPDMAAPAAYEAMREQLKPGCALLFAHGFNIHYRRIEPDPSFDVILVAPKGPGDLVRRQFQEGRGVPCLMAVAQDATGRAAARALGYAPGIGGTRGGVLETTFAEETETDLFGEQAVLCGGVTELVLQGFETLTEAGYQPEVAYFECMHELKLIVDLLHEGGLAKMHEFVSETAKYGDLTRGPRVVDDHTRERMREVLGEIRDGTFAREWAAEYEAGLGNYRALMEQDLNHPVERIGRELRARMSWLKAGKRAAA